MRSMNDCQKSVACSGVALVADIDFCSLFITLRLLMSKLWRILTEVMKLTLRPKTVNREIIRMSEVEEIRKEFTGLV